MGEEKNESIKKIDDLKKARKVVLDYINKNEIKEEPAPEPAPVKEIYAPPKPVRPVSDIKPAKPASAPAPAPSLMPKAPSLAPPMLQEKKTGPAVVSKFSAKERATAEKPSPAVKKPVKGKKQKQIAGDRLFGPVRLRNSFILSIKLFAYFTFVVVMMALIFYFSFSLLVINFNIDNAISRDIDYYFPVPAIISKIGIIRYYEYQDAINNGMSGDIKFELIKKMIMKNEGRPIDDELAVEKITGINFWSLVE